MMKAFQLYWNLIIIIAIVVADGLDTSSSNENKPNHQKYLTELRELQERLEELYGAGAERVSNLEVIQDDEKIATVTRNPNIDLFTPKGTNSKPKQTKVASDDKWKSSRKWSQSSSSKEKHKYKPASKASWKAGFSKNNNRPRLTLPQGTPTLRFGSSLGRKTEGFRKSNANFGTFARRTGKTTQDDESGSYDEGKKTKEEDISGDDDEVQDQTEAPSVGPENQELGVESESNDETDNLDMNGQQTRIGNGDLKWTSPNVELIPIADNTAPVPPNKTRIQLELDNYDSFEPVQFQLQNEKLRASVKVEPLNGVGVENVNNQSPVAYGQYGPQPILNYDNGLQAPGPYQQDFSQNQYPQPYNNYNAPPLPPTHHLSQVEKDILRKKFGPSPESSNNPVSQFFGKIEEQILPNKYKKLRFPPAQAPPFVNGHNMHQHHHHGFQLPHPGSKRFQHHPHFLTQKHLAKAFLKKRLREMKKQRKLRQ